MPNLVTLNTELEQAVGRRAALRQEHPGATMPEEARSEDERLYNRVSGLRTLIEEERQRERDVQFNDTATYLDKPLWQVPRAVNADEDGRKSLLGAGWNLRNGVFFRQTSVRDFGGHQIEYAMYEEEALFGPLPTDDDATRDYYTKSRAIIQPEYRNAWTKWLRAKGGSDSMAFSRLTASEQNALSEGSDGTGGFLVPPDVQAEILARLPQTSVMSRICRTVMTSRDSIRFPAVAPNSTSGSIYSSGFVGSMVGETPAFSDTDPGFQAFDIAIKKGRVATKLSNDWLSDAAANMLAFLAQDGARNMGLLEDSELLTGNGTGIHPLGLLSHPLALTLVASGGMFVDVEGTTSNTISNTTADAGSAPKIKGLVYKLPSQYVENSTWLMRRAVQGNVAALVDGNGRPYWNGYNESGFTRPQMVIEGSPVNNSEFMGADGSVAAGPSTIPLAFGDFSNYIIGRRAELSTVVLRERFADTDQTGIIIFSRFGGGLWNYDAIRLGGSYS